MSMNLICPHCDADLGKDTENMNPAYCSNCGTDNIYNPRGITPEQDRQDQKNWIAENPQQSEEYLASIIGCKPEEVRPFVKELLDNEQQRISDDRKSQHLANIKIASDLYVELVEEGKLE